MISQPVPVLVPLADGQHIPSQVIRSWLAQTVDLAIRPFTRPGATGCKYSEGKCRTELLDASAGLQKSVVSGVAAMFDRDVVLTCQNAVRLAHDLICADDRLGAVHIRFKPNLTEAHFDIGCVLFRIAAVRGIVFTSETTCHCHAFSEHIRKLGMTQCYLDGVQGFELNC